jgi:hypothetical protein
MDKNYRQKYQQVIVGNTDTAHKAASNFCNHNIHSELKEFTIMMNL